MEFWLLRSWHTACSLPHVFAVMSWKPSRRPLAALPHNICSILPWRYMAAGELEVAAEFNAKDNNVAGSVDFVILSGRFAISILEVRERCRCLHLAWTDFTQCCISARLSMMSCSCGVTQFCTMVIIHKSTGFYNLYLRKVCAGKITWQLEGAWRTALCFNACLPWAVLEEAQAKETQAWCRSNDTGECTYNYVLFTVAMLELGSPFCTASLHPIVCQ